MVDNYFAFIHLACSKSFELLGRQCTLKSCWLSPLTPVMFLNGFLAKPSDSYPPFSWDTGTYAPNSPSSWRYPSILWIDFQVGSCWTCQRHLRPLSLDASDCLGGYGAASDSLTLLYEAFQSIILSIHWTLMADAGNCGFDRTSEAKLACHHCYHTAGHPSRKRWGICTFHQCWSTFALGGLSVDCLRVGVAAGRARASLSFVLSHTLFRLRGDSRDWRTPAFSLHLSFVSTIDGLLSGRFIIQYLIDFSVRHWCMVGNYCPFSLN